MDIKYEDVFTYEHLYESGNKCLSGVMWKKSSQLFKINLDYNCNIIFKELRDRTYKSDGFYTFKINERGKTRLIQAVTLKERTVQKTLCRYALKPIIKPCLIYDNAASLEGKGTDFAVKRFREHLRWHYSHYGLQGGILICDFHDYFHSIDHDILLSMLRKKIKDDDLYNLTKYFIDCFGEGNGLGLGSEVSQLCAIFYPNKIDHFIKEKFHIHGYARYMDDFYVISEDLDLLREIYNYIKEASTELKLTLNEKHTHIYKFLDIPTFTYLKNRTRLLPSGKIVMKITRENIKHKRSWLRKQKKLLDEDKIDFDDVVQSMNTWLSYARKHKNSYYTVKSVMDYFNIVFEEDIMLQKEINKNQKRILQQLNNLQSDVEKLNIKFNEHSKYSATDMSILKSNVNKILSKLNNEEAV